MKKTILIFIFMISLKSQASEMCASLFAAPALTEAEINQVIVELRELKSQVFIASHHAVASALFKQKLADLTQYLSHAEVQKRMREFEIVKPKEASRKPKKQEKQKITQAMIDDMLLQNLAEAFLLNNKLTLEGKNGELALMYAMEKDRIDIFEKLIEMGALKSIRALNRETLEYASMKKDLSYLKILLKDKTKINATVTGKALESVSSMDITNSVKLLIKAGADLELGSNGRTPLMNSIFYQRHNNISKALIDSGANLKAVDKNGDSLIYYALRNRDPHNKINFLIKNGAPVNLVNKKGRTALHQAVDVKTDWKPGLISALVQAGANVNKADLSGNTPLHHVMAYRYFDFKAEKVAELLKEGANPSLKNKTGETPYAIAKRKKLLDVVAVFEKAGITK